MKLAKKTITSFLILVAFFPVTSFYIKGNSSDTQKELIKTDKEFSDKSFKDGILTPFLKYADNDIIIIREKYLPIKGKRELEKLYSLNPADVNNKLSWVPEKADISESGDLGYTYGNWNYSGVNEKGSPVQNNVNYVTIWKKQKEGEWKVAMYSGSSNEMNETEFKAFGISSNPNK